METTIKELIKERMALLTSEINTYEQVINETSNVFVKKATKESMDECMIRLSECEVLLTKAIEQKII
jgi:hypothetical protein